MNLKISTQNSFAEGEKPDPTEDAPRDGIHGQSLAQGQQSSPAETESAPAVSRREVGAGGTEGFRVWELLR